MEMNRGGLSPIIYQFPHRFHLRLVISPSDPDSPMLLYITPCGATVHYQLYAVKGDLSEALKAESLTYSDDVELIAGEADDSRMKFYSHHTPHKLILRLRSSSPSSTRVFFTGDQTAMDSYYPPMPKDSRIASALKTEGDTQTALIAWKIADQIRSADPSRYRFCAVVSHKNPSWAYCDHVDEGLDSIHCVPQINNSMTISKLRIGKRHFVTLFVRDNQHGTTSSYETLQISAPSQPSDSRPVTSRQKSRILRDAALQAARLSHGIGSSTDYTFQVANSTRAQRVLLIVHSCNGYVRMSVFRNGILLKKSEPFTGFRRFLITNVRAGQLRFQISNDDGHSKTIRLWASTHSNKSPYPMLPEDTSVKIVRRTCTTATLQWLRSADERAEYCIYKRREKANFLEQLVSRSDNLCEGGISSSELVGCYRHRGPIASNELPLEDLQGLIESTVTDLQPAATYRFDLLATPLRKKNKQSLPYRTVWVRTNAHC
ncbi:hypothetical protein WR25_12888 isoform B [Diploscapter pachys]|uniref:Fibronectin type-III domain-containing protein n=1 Tax=Diploscapter pachys TaxID=2018661 RepID=A0A2A2LVJ7_9BILA|nr:hypothetical protein WR25_12888 isoform B [Diploscapter pachys]